MFISFWYDFIETGAIEKFVFFIKSIASIFIIFVYSNLYYRKLFIFVDISLVLYALHSLLLCILFLKNLKYLAVSAFLFIEVCVVFFFVLLFYFNFFVFYWCFKLLFIVFMKLFSSDISARPLYSTEYFQL